MSLIEPLSGILSVVVRGTAWGVCNPFCASLKVLLVFGAGEMVNYAAILCSIGKTSEAKPPKSAQAGV